MAKVTVRLKHLHTVSHDLNTALNREKGHEERQALGSKICTEENMMSPLPLR